MLRIAPLRIKLTTDVGALQETVTACRVAVTRRDSAADEPRAAQPDTTAVNHQKSQITITNHKSQIELARSLVVLTQ